MSNFNKAIDYSIVIPVYQNEASLEDTFNTLKEGVIDNNPHYSVEVIFVDDGSTDNSFKILQKIYETYPELIVLIKLTRNFGTYPAIVAGYEKAKGKCIVNISADLQDPPELINEMLNHYFNDDCNIVICHRESRDESFYRKLTSKIFYRIIKKYCYANMPIGGFDFILISNKIKDEILENLEADFFLQGEVLWAGHDVKYIPYKRREREKGASQWTFSKKLKWFLDSIMSCSFFPIRFISSLGMFVALVGFIYAIVVFIQRLSSDDYIYGWAPIVILILVLSGLQILMLGMIGEYVWRTLSQSRNRPKYVVSKIIDRIE